MQKNISSKNADRFVGFAKIYEDSRPTMPLFPIQLIKRYLGKYPDTVVDLGCGTGLSTIIWQGNCKKIIGIEPSDDMRDIAAKKCTDAISFLKGYSHETGLGDNSADVVVCSQSFHWMEPDSTLQEVNRILGSGGIFVTIDCDWPPITDWKIDNAYMLLFDKIHDIENTNPLINERFVRYDKAKHLSNIKNSNYFRFARDIVFSNAEKCTAERLINLTMSQGSLQDILKIAPNLINKNIENFKILVRQILADNEIEIYFSYRMRIAVK